MKIKALLALGGVSVAGTSVIGGGYHYFSTKANSIRFALRGYKLISDLPEKNRFEQWGEEVESDFGNISKKIPDLEGTTDRISAGKKLEAWCSKQVELDAKENVEILDLVKRYCLIRSIENQLFRKGISLLGDDEDQWKSTYGKRKQSKSSRSDIGLTGEWRDDGEAQDLPKIKTWCFSNREKDFLVSEDLYKQVLLWCTLEGTIIP